MRLIWIGMIALALAGCGGDTTSCPTCKQTDLTAEPGIDAGDASAPMATDAATDSGTPPPATSTVQTFPSLGMYFLGAPSWDTPAFVQRAAVSDIVILSAFNGWRDPNTGADSLKMIQDINAASTRHTKVINYMIPTVSDDYAYFPAYMAHVNANNWFARAAFPSGALVADGGGAAPPGAGYWFNVVQGGPTDSAGRTYGEYAADYMLDYTYNGGAAGLATDGTDPVNHLWAGVYQDSMSPCYATAADWLRVGSTSGACSDWAIGQLAISQRVKANAPVPSLMFGNLAGAYNATLIAAFQTAYGGQFDGGDLENLFDIEWVPGGSTAQMVAAYQAQMGLLNSNQLGVATTYQLTPNGEDSIDTTVPWQAARRALAICLVLGNARCDLHDQIGTDSQQTLTYAAFWLDEYAVNRTTQAPCTTPGTACSADIGYLGTAVDPPQTTPYQGCYWRRRFQYGEVWWSPQSCSAGTINFGRTVNFINGTQAPLFNTGGNGATHPIGSRDGIVVLYQ